MAEKPAGQPSNPPASPFAGLDTSLLRSTRPRPVPESTPDPAVPDDPAGPVAAAEQTPVPSQRAGQRTQRRPASRGTTVARNHDTNASDQVTNGTLESVRRAVRTLGKEAATYRFTQDEKRVLASIVYAYKEQGVRTSENEITRIALNYLFDEYQQNGQHSILARVLTLLNR